jgi:hypothetical protein
MRIAIDFDGTIVEHMYPAIGKEMLFAFDTMKELQKQKHQLILWTYRSGKELEEAVEFCRENGVEFYAVNKNYPEEQWDGSASRKIQADVYIDDLNLGGFPGWSAVWQMLNPVDDDPEKQIRQLPKKRRNFFSRLFSGNNDGERSMR